MSSASLLGVGPRAWRRIVKTEACIFCSQRRTASSRAARAPTTRLKQERQRAMVVTPELKAARQKSMQEVDADIKKLPLILAPEMKLRLCQSTAAVAEAVSRNQALFLHQWRQSGEAFTSFASCAKISSASLDEVYDLTFILRNKGYLEDNKTGRRLVRACSEQGHAEATIQTAASALRQDITSRGILRTREAMFALDRLRTLAQQGNVRAIVLEANLARHTGQTDKAIKLYEQALERIIEDEDSEPKDKYAKIQDELSSPWIELAYLYVTQGQNVNALKAYMVGLDKDDPMAYFNLARLDYHMAGNQHTHDWLYNMTKAAASGHYRAAFELGDYYANSPANPPQAQPSFLKRLQDFGSFLYKPNLNLDPKTNIHHHDAFANTPEMRIKLAQQWLTVARKNWFLPANISLALLHLQKFIYPSGTLSSPLDPFGDQEGADSIANPIFDVEKGMMALAEVLTACVRIPEARRVSKNNIEYRMAAQPWSEHAEVLEIVEDEEVLKDLKAQAETIADAAGIDIKSTEGLRKEIPRLGLLYKHKGTRGEGLWEVDEEKV